MIPLIAVPNVHMPAPITSESFVGVPTQTSVLSRIPFHAVPSTVSSEQIYNNTRGGSQYASNPPVGDDLDIPRMPETAGNIIRANISAPRGYNYTPQFMAQVLGQGGAANDNGMIESIFQSRIANSPTPDTETLESFSLSRYLPSNASKPTAQAAAPELVMPKPDAKPERTVQNAKTAPPPVRRDYSGDAKARNYTMRIDESMIRPRGLESYIATFSRNVANLTAPREDAMAISL